MSVFRKIWGEFSCNTHFEIRPFSLLPTNLKTKKINLLFSVYDTPVNRSNKMTSNDAPVIKQNVVRQYIKNVGGVDRNDNLGGDYSSIKKSLKWRIKVALHYNQEAT